MCKQHHCDSSSNRIGNSVPTECRVAILPQRNCKNTSISGGLFNPCRDISHQLVKLRTQLDKAIQSDCLTNAPSKMNQKSSAHLRRALTSSPSRLVPAQPIKQTRSARTYKQPLLYCVRRSDGYYFPSPNSQYQAKIDTHIVLNQCRFICGVMGMEVFALYDRNLETSEMTSLESGTAYISHPAAIYGK
ncbi:uncharacterized protein DUF2865 [Ochrobactrum sp. BH3]|nr:uncharacterized protein DUF2865 [Ochrobactrum sp. BH3]